MLHTLEKVTLAAQIWTLDLRGFGASEGEHPGHFGDKSGGQKIIDDIVEVSERTEKERPTLLIGHSTGAIFALLSLAQLSTPPKGLILSSVGLLQPWELRLAKFLFGLQLLRHGKQGCSPWINAQTREKYALELKLSPNDEWRSSDPEAVKTLTEGSTFTQAASVESWREILRGLQQISGAIKFNQPPECLLLAGRHDPSTQFGAGTFRLAQALSAEGWTCTHRFISNARHDLWAGRTGHDTLESVNQYVQKFLS